MTVLRAIKVGSPLSFLGVGIAICYLYQLADCWRPLVVQFSTELLVVEEPLGECVNGLAVANVGDGVPRFQEAPDEATQGLPEGLMKLFQVILGAWLLVGGHVVLDEDLLEVIPRLDGVLLQDKGQIICRLVKHDRKVVCHDALVSTHGFYGDLV